MPLLPLRHPAWIMVLTIGLFGASLTAFMAGAYVFSKVLIAATAFAAVLAGRAARRQVPFNRGGEDS